MTLLQRLVAWFTATKPEHMCVDYTPTANESKDNDNA